MAKKTEATVTLKDGRRFRNLNDIAHMRQRLGVMLGGTGAVDFSWNTFKATDEEPGEGQKENDGQGDDGGQLKSRSSGPGAPRTELSEIRTSQIPALLHCFREIFDNSLDEHLKGGHCNEVYVEQTGPFSFSILDNGRGIPPELFYVFMKARSGTNFDDDKFSRGQNGVGAKAIRAVSSYFRVTSKFDGKTYTQVMTPGKNIRDLLVKLPLEVQNAYEEAFETELALGHGVTKEKLIRAAMEDGCVARRLTEKESPVRSKSGTLIEVSLNPLVFSEKEKRLVVRGGLLPSFEADPDWTLAGSSDVPPIDPRIVDAIARETALLFPKLRVNVSLPEVKPGGEVDPKIRRENSYKFVRGAVSLGEDLKRPFHRMTYEAKEGEKDFKCDAMVIVGGEGMHLSFVNGSATKGGTHVEDLLNFIADEIRDSARDIKKLAKEINVTRDDVRSAVFLFVDVRMTAPSFSSQTKEHLTDTWIKPHLRLMAQRAVKTITSKTPEIVAAIVEAAKKRHESRASLEAEKQVKKSGKIRPVKLVDANTTQRGETILFLAEGDSAAAGFREVRDDRTMGILPLKGVVMNCAGLAFHKAIKNDEIAAIVSAAGLSSPSGVERPRGFEPYFGKIVILTDADVDGAHIRSLLVTFFCTYWKWLATDGHLYRAVPPLYELLPERFSEVAEEDIPQDAGWPMFANDEETKEKLLKKHAKEKLLVFRNKGLGEMSRSAWRHTLTSPDCIIRLDYDELAAETISKWSDKSPEAAEQRRAELQAGMQAFR